ncbi:hypothetical protein B1H10_08310 [candidate division KSB1 bacterium 4484_188]|nr:MAG: hypothetical protein B1H10_08310 [candidate division KSB1 bacterium 4484_188]
MKYSIPVLAKLSISIIRGKKNIRFWMYYLDAIGALEKRGEIRPRNSSIKWMDFTKDLNSLFRLKKENKISVPQILASFKNLRVDGYFAGDDPAPFFEELYLLLRAIILRLFRRNH